MADATTTGQPGAFDWIGQLFTGAGNLATAGLDMRDASRAAGMADPWAANRPQYATALNNYMASNQVNPAAATARSSNAYDMLQNLLQNPQSLTSMPGYQFGLNQALEGVNRAAGSSGLLNSGNRLMALQDRGQGYAQDWQKQMFNELLGNVNAGVNVDTLGLNAQGQGFNQLDRLAGVTAGNPVSAADALLRGRLRQGQDIGAGIGGITNGLGGALPMIQRLLGGGGNALTGSGNSFSGVGTGGDWGTDLSGAGTGGDWGQDIFDNWDLMGNVGGGGGVDFGSLFNAGDIFGGL